jgi:ApaG protein
MDVFHPEIKIDVSTRYIPAQSEPDNKRFVFAYTITISNLGEEPAQLTGRRWLITDSNGKQISVEGEGVVGEQPIIAPRTQYSYTSGTAIETPLGFMQGEYVMVDSSTGDKFIAEIAPFRLATPNLLH